MVKDLTGSKTIVIDRNNDFENGVAIEFFKNDSGKYGVRLIDTDVNENVSCKLWEPVDYLKAKDYFDKNRNDI